MNPFRSLLLTLVVGLPLLACTQPVEQRPVIRNVLLISVDTLRADHLQAYGYSRATSPYMDKLADRGVLFENALSQAPWTTPAHAAMLASNYPEALGLGTFWDRRPLPDEAVLLAEVLKEEGYHTFGIVDGGLVSSPFGFHRGFEKFEDEHKGMSATVDLAQQMLESREEDRPFFMFLHTYDVHEYTARGAGAELVRPYGGELVAGIALSALVQSRDKRSIVERFRRFDRRFVVDQYDGGIRGVDDQLRRLGTYLETSGLMEETLVLITSDHGEELFDHGRSGHGYTLYDENLHVPLILAHASLTVGRVAQPVRIIDLAPTIVDLLGLEAPALWQGLSLRPFLGGEGRPLTVFSSHTHHKPTTAVRSGGMKLIRREGALLELYDLESDPHEQSNLAGEGHAMQAVLEERLRRWEELNEFLAEGNAGGSAVGLQEDLREQLRALGYLGEDDH